MRPHVCPTCTAAIGKPIRHAKRRLCSLVQAERRYAATPKGKAANRAKAANRRKAARHGTS